MNQMMWLFLTVVLAFGCSPKESAPPVSSTNTTSEPEIPSTPGLVRDTPENTMAMVFKIAQNGDFRRLTTLCAAQAGPEAKRICTILNAEPAIQKTFMNDFRLGKISGEVLIEENKASVPFTYGEALDKTATMTLIEQADQWYIVGY